MIKFTAGVSVGLALGVLAFAWVLGRAAQQGVITVTPADKP